MTDVKDITPDLDRLDDQLDDLEETLQPLLGNLEGMASELPLLDKAKLFSLTAYAIESLLFCKSTRPQEIRHSAISVSIR
jgi:exosome complex protein LRP1